MRYRKRYRKLALEVDAFRVEASAVLMVDPPDWIESALALGDCAIGSLRIYEGAFVVTTPHGPIRFCLGDWIVKDQFGNLHPYTDEDFWATFEELE